MSRRQLRLFIWEGNGISDAYHDDGTLVVLAESSDQARQLIRDEVATRRERIRASFREKWGRESTYEDDGKDSDFFDGSDAALDREPDRVVELDAPKWVAFNGGGYD